MDHETLQSIIPFDPIFIVGEGLVLHFPQGKKKLVPRQMKHFPNGNLDTAQAGFLKIQNKILEILGSVFGLNY